MDPTTSDAKNRELVPAHYPGFALKQNIERALAASQTTNGDVSTLQQLLSAAQENISALEELSEKGQTYKMWLFPCLPTERSARLARKVFDTTELAEAILSHLHPKSLLRAQLINRRMRDIIQSSVKLQRHLFLVPYEPAHLRMLDSAWSFEPLPRTVFIMEDRSKSNLHKNLVHVRVRIGRELPKLGSRVRQMHLWQPPIIAMSYYASCYRSSTDNEDGYDSDDDGVGEIRRVFRQGGLTVNDLLKAAEKMMVDHKFCVKAHYAEHEADGFVRPKIIFGGRVKVAADDPIILEVKERAKEEEEREAFQAKMEEYVVAKQDGKCKITA